MNNENLGPGQFQNPWMNLPPDQKSRTTIDVSAEARAKLGRVYTKSGVLQTTINLLLFKLINELESHGLTSFNPDAYAIAVSRAVITLGDFNCQCERCNERRRSLAHPAPADGSPLPVKANRRNVGRRARSVAQPAEGSPNASNAGSAS